MTTPEKGSLVANEPVLVATFVTWLFTQLGAVVLGHTHLVSSDQWSSLTTALVPIISAVLLGLIGWVTRKYVTPFWKAVQGKINDLGPIAEYVEQKVQEEVEKALQDYLNSSKVKVEVDGEVITKSVATPSVGAPAPGEYNGTAQAG